MITISTSVKEAKNNMDYEIPDKQELIKALDDEDHFVGTNLDEEKMKRYERINELCKKIAKAVPGMSFEWHPITNRDPNAFALLAMSNVTFWSRTDVNRALAEALTLADNVSITAVGDDGKIRVGIGIFDVWKDHYYDNDMEHGK